MTIAGYWLQIDGFPYLLGTKDLPGLLPTTFTPSDDTPTGAGAYPGRLDWPRGTISEEIDPVTGALRAGSMTFTLVDDPADAVLDRYLSIDPRRIATSTVSTTAASTDTDIQLSSPIPSSISGLSYPAVVWIDEEAILVDSLTTGLVDCTRGYYGTRASAHRVDTEIGQYPEVWPTFPFGTGRRVILWAVDDGDFTSAVAVWRGYLRAPRLARNGAGYELPCEHISTWEMQRPFGGLTYSVRLRGFSSQALQFRYHLPNGYNGVNDGEQMVSTYHGWADGIGVMRATADEFFEWARSTLSTRLTGTTLAGQTKTAQTKVSVRIDRNGSDGFFEVGAADTGAGVLAAVDVVQPAVSVYQFGQETTAPAPNRPGGVYRGSLTFRLPTAALIGLSDYSRAFPVERLDGLPATFDPATTYSDGPFTTRIRSVLTAPYDDNTRLLILPDSSTANDSSIGGGPSVTGTARYIDSRGGSVASGLQQKTYLRTGVNENGSAVRVYTGATRCYIDKSMRLSYAQWVVCDHWVYGLRRAIENDNVSTGVDPRNWEWSYADDVAKITSGNLSAREWFLDGGKTIKDVLQDTLTLDGCALSVGPYGKLRIIPVQPARQHWGAADVSAEIDCAPVPNVGTSRVPIIKGSLPQWTTIADALTNVVALGTDSIDVTVRDIRSFQRYGQRSKLDLKIEGIPLDRQSGEDPRAISQRLLQRITGLWSEPVFQAVVTIPASDRSGNSLMHGTTGIYPGSYVYLRNGFNIPDGEGARGFDLQAVFVAGRRCNLSSHTIELILWLFPMSYCYAPCVKAASITAVSGVVTADTMFVKKQSNRASDYSGGYYDVYHTGPLGKGGVGAFAAGDKVRLVTRDSTSPSQETYTVSSVDETNGTITMTTAIGTAPYNWPTLASTGWVDVIPATYTTCVAAQKYHQFVGDGDAAEGEIGASSDPSREFAP